MRFAFQEQGLLALSRAAFGMSFDRRDDNGLLDVRDGIAIVSVRGPLMHHAHYWCDSYDAIKARVIEALSKSPRAIMLSIDSPGGLVSGCFDTAQEIRAAAAAAGVPLYAYVDGQALSAAYALACAASKIFAPKTASLGSIGVIEAMVDATKQDAAFGVAFKLIASGARKTDGNPHVAISDDAIAAVKRNVDTMAGVFFEHVAATRSVSPEEVRSLQAAILVGADAKPMLCDEIASLDQALAMIATPTTTAPPQAAGEATMPSANKAEAKAKSKGYEEAIAALRKAAESDDPDEAKRAKRMLRAELAEDDGEEPDGDETPKKKGESEGKKAEGSEEPPEKKDEGEAKALASKALEQSSEALATLKAQAQAAVESERATLLASRPDFDAATKALLAKASIEDVRSYVKDHPRRPMKAAATAVVGGTRAEGQLDSDHQDRLSPEDARALDERMGLAARAATVHLQGNVQVLPTMGRAQARSELERFEKREAERLAREREHAH